MTTHASRSADLGHDFRDSVLRHAENGRWPLTLTEEMAIAAINEADKLRAALELAEAVYRLNVVQPGEPSSVLRAMQLALGKEVTA